MEIVGSIREAILYIHSMYNEPLQVSDIAAEIYLSPSYFANAFRVITGFTVKNYIIRYRLYQAAQDLTKTDMPIISIAYIHGFSSQQAFSKSFVGIYGASPAQFRRNCPPIDSFPPQDLWKEHMMTMNLQECFNQVKFISKESFFVAGIEVDIDYAETGGLTPIQKAWELFATRGVLKQIPNQVQQGVTYGITHSETENDRGKYIVCTEVETLDNLPVGLVGRRFNPCDFAVFSTTLKILQTGEFWKSFYAHWLPNSDYRLPDEPLHQSYATFNQYPAIEVYDESFVDHSSSILIYAPIVKRS